jgi:hypothetical protein
MYLTNSHICFFAHMPSREVGVDSPLLEQQLTQKTESGAQVGELVEEGSEDDAMEQALVCVEERCIDLVPLFCRSLFPAWRRRSEICDLRGIAWGKGFPYTGAPEDCESGGRFDAE